MPAVWGLTAQWWWLVDLCLLGAAALLWWYWHQPVWCVGKGFEPTNIADFLDGSYELSCVKVDKAEPDSQEPDLWNAVLYEENP